MLPDWEDDDDDSRPAKKSKGKKSKGKKKDSGGKKQKTKNGGKSSPLWAKILIAFGGVLMVMSLGTVIAFEVGLAKATEGIGDVGIDSNGNDAVVQGKALEGTLNILLVGVDDGQSEGTWGDDRDVSKEGVRADSIMILHVPASHQEGYLVSLPRDLWVKIPKFTSNGKTIYAGGSGKLNSAFMAGYGNLKGGGPGIGGGLDLLMKTINQLTGIKFNAAMTVNFTGFTAAVKQLGGVTMYVDEKVTSVHYGKDKNGNACVPASFDSSAVAHPNAGCNPRVFEVGERRMNAEEALDYTRQREWMQLDDGDYGRQRHQQQFIKALVKEAKSQGLTNPANIGKTLALIKSMGSALNMWTNNVAIEDWFFTLKDLAGSDIGMIKTNNGWYNSVDKSLTGGQSAEALSPESTQMLSMLAQGKINDFVTQHPDWLGSDSTKATAPH